MREAEFREWLEDRGYDPNTVNAQLGRVKRLSTHYGDLEKLGESGIEALRNELAYSRDDERRGRSNPAKFEISGSFYKGLASYRATLNYISRFLGREGDVSIEHKLRARFLAKYPDFLDQGAFAGTEGRYATGYRSRVDDLLSGLSTSETPRAVLDQLIQASKTHQRSPSQPFFADGVIGRVLLARDADPDAFDAAVADLLENSQAIPEAVSQFNERFWPLLSQSTEGNPYRDTRVVPSTLLALVKPNEAISVRYQAYSNASKLLNDRFLFHDGPMTGDEYRKVLDLARQFMEIFERWDWQPRDLWDVHGFLLATCGDRDLENAGERHATPYETVEERSEKMSATNLILYGPPGTGKTYRTAIEAVQLCDGMADYGEDADGRAALMKRYDELRRKGRIGFVTFHQNYSYEDFVEGLRPQQTSQEDGSAGSGAGFSLVARDGIFKNIAKVAAENRGRALTHDLPPFDGSRKIFKMSLGRSWASEDDAIYQRALEGNYVVLGWGGDVDWSASEYDDWEAIKRRWRQDFPDAHGNDPNMSQTYTFRANMEVGSLIVISDGNMKFRAIAEVTGPYRFEPDGEYNHRRAVRWLWHSDDSLPRERIYRKQLSQVSAYQMQSRQVEWDALEQIVATGGDAGETSGEPEPHVLVIDEINRANISKVFGELITLIEPDKRTGRENALKVTLPYSGDEFGVPANLHIIGTMNTADRSIAQLDTALRRRFRFEEIAPDPKLLEAVDGIDLPHVLSAMNERIEYLVDREHRIGHAFFMHCRSRAEIDAAMRDKVLPLLQEYFFDDWSRIAAVVGKGFVAGRTLRVPPGIDGGEDRISWSVRDPFAGNAYVILLGDETAPEEAVSHGQSADDETAETRQPDD